MNVFNRLAPFIQEFIYQNKWEELRGNQGRGGLPDLVGGFENVRLHAGASFDKTYYAECKISIAKTSGNINGMT